MLELFTVFAAERDERTCGIFGALKLKAEVLRPWQMSRVSQHKERQRQARHKFAYLKMKKQYFCTCIFHFALFTTVLFSYSPRREIFAVVGTTRTNFHSSTNQFNSRIVRMAKLHFQMKFSLSSMSPFVKLSNAWFSYNRLDLIALYMSNYDRSYTISSDLVDYTKASKFLVSKELLWCCVEESEA